MLVYCIDCVLGKYCDIVGQFNYIGKDYLIICRLFLFGCIMYVEFMNDLVLLRMVYFDLEQYYE